MRRVCVALVILLSACAALDRKERATIVPPPRPVSRAATAAPKPPPAPVSAETAAAAPAPAPATERSTSAAGPAASASRARAQVAATTNGARKPDGVPAPRCVITRHVERASKSVDVFAKNACAFEIEVKAACLPSYAEPNDPYPGTYALDSWLFTLTDGQEQLERQSAMCIQKGRKVLYASCQVGIPYFTSRDGRKFGCFR